MGGKLFIAIVLLLFVIAFGIIIYNGIIGDPNLVLDPFAADCRDKAAAMGVSYQVVGVRDKVCMIEIEEGEYIPFDSYKYIETK